MNDTTWAIVQVFIVSMQMAVSYAMYKTTKLLVAVVSKEGEE